ncbi:Predicted Fe-Mo cluster-binding protein, NifX family [Roseomonas rosea]|uniref:Predicted Fe-Mo cluster-binding protein, NifX family n=1 Tax=Muricoccus roseus TaxID=198092 RepID=A0A1M6QNW7_9PROT|nr:NifB/NifX family molybdenum-iron cluster-binding protein [Roseomonas rosea]SHK21780.1 Predicted Fe-Mo cluster-binding protein, NifX family [Roseomonas rosea]
MAIVACVSPPSASRIAITVMKSEASPALCPFFGKCDGIWIVDTSTGVTEFRANPQRTPAALCDLILSANPGRLICSFIGDVEKRRLCSAGVDVRLGSCVNAIEELVASFQQLTVA